jgi:histidine phosphotransferase ChpT
MPAADAVLDDLYLTAFMSSKICHDLVGPVGAIANGLELLDEETDEDTRAYAMNLIRFSAAVANARLEYARLAFGASTALGADIDLRHAEGVARTFVEEGKHKLHWQSSLNSMEKSRARLLLQLISVAMPAIPAGGDLSLTVSGDAANASFEIRCKGRNARIPEGVEDIFHGRTKDVDPRSIIGYYATRLARSAGMALTVRKDGADIVFTAKPRR